MDLTEFLLARIAEDERGMTQWVADVTAAGFHGWLPGATAPPTPRQLAECEAKRRIVNALVAEDGSGDTSPAGAGAHFTKRQVVKILALPYADHPDYQPEWRP